MHSTIILIAGILILIHAVPNERNLLSFVDDLLDNLLDSNDVSISSKKADGKTLSVNIETVHDFNIVEHLSGDLGHLAGTLSVSFTLVNAVKGLKNDLQNFLKSVTDALAVIPPALSVIISKIFDVTVILATDIAASIRTSLKMVFRIVEAAIDTIAGELGAAIFILRAAITNLEEAIVKFCISVWQVEWNEEIKLLETDAVGVALAVQTLCEVVLIIIDVIVAVKTPITVGFSALVAGLAVILTTTLHIVVEIMLSAQQFLFAVDLNILQFSLTILQKLEIAATAIVSFIARSISTTKSEFVKIAGGVSLKLEEIVTALSAQLTAKLEFVIGTINYGILAFTYIKGALALKLSGTLDAVITGLEHTLTTFEVTIRSAVFTFEADFFIAVKTAMEYIGTTLQAAYKNLLSVKASIWSAFNMLSEKIQWFVQVVVNLVGILSTVAVDIAKETITEATVALKIAVTTFVSAIAAVIGQIAKVNEKIDAVIAEEVWALLIVLYSTLHISAELARITAQFTLHIASNISIDLKIAADFLLEAAQLTVNIVTESFKATLSVSSEWLLRISIELSRIYLKLTTAFTQRSTQLVAALHHTISEDLNLIAVDLQFSLNIMKTKVNFLLNEVTGLLQIALELVAVGLREAVDGAWSSILTALDKVEENFIVILQIVFNVLGNVSASMQKVFINVLSCTYQFAVAVWNFVTNPSVIVAELRNLLNDTLSPLVGAIVTLISNVSVVLSVLVNKAEDELAVGVTALTVTLAATLYIIAQVIKCVAENISRLNAEFSISLQFFVRTIVNIAQAIAAATVECLTAKVSTIKDFAGKLSIQLLEFSADTELSLQFTVENLINFVPKLERFFIAVLADLKIQLNLIAPKLKSALYTVTGSLEAAINVVIQDTQTFVWTEVMATFDIFNIEISAALQIILNGLGDAGSSIKDVWQKILNGMQDLNKAVLVVAGSAGALIETVIALAFSAKAFVQTVAIVINGVGTNAVQIETEAVAALTVVLSAVIYAVSRFVVLSFFQVAATVWNIIKVAADVLTQAAQSIISLLSGIIVALATINSGEELSQHNEFISLSLTQIAVAMSLNLLGNE